MIHAIILCVALIGFSSALQYAWTTSDSLEGAYSSAYTKIVCDESGKLCAASGYDLYSSVRGIFISTNYGMNWTHQVSVPGLARSVAMGSTGQFIAAAIESSGNDFIYISKDYGTTWIKTAAPNYEYGYYKNITISSTGQYLAAILTGSGYKGVYTSADYGNTWTVTAGFFAEAITGDSTGRHLAAVSATNYYPETVFVSGNYGQSWTDVQNTNNSTTKDVWEANVISSDKTGQYLIMGGPTTEIHISDDFGLTWIKRSSNDFFCCDLTSVAIDSSGKYLGAASNGWLFVSDNFGGTWQNLSAVSTIPFIEHVTIVSGGQQIVATGFKIYVGWSTST